MGYIYLITNKINGKQYVGQTICNDINDRWKKHKRVDKYSLGNYLYNTYIKYGIENFSFQLICICFDEDCNTYEKEYIKKYNTLSPNGYNLKEGGNNSKHHPETIELIRASLKGRLTRPITEQIRNNISESLKGDKNPNFGKKMSDEQKKKISEKRIQLLKDGKILKNKITEKQLNALEKGRELIRRKVGKFDNNNNLLEQFDSITEASNNTNISYSTISKVCNNTKGYKTAGGFIWKFIIT